MNIAYIRVSTVDQNEERQINTNFTEKVSAKDAKRPTLMEMI